MRASPMTYQLDPGGLQRRRAATPRDISGAIYRTYVLKAADRGKKVKVKLSFKDDAGNVESRTSDAYPASGTVAAAAIWSATLIGCRRRAQYCMAASSGVCHDSP